MERKSFNSEKSKSAFTFIVWPKKLFHCDWPKRGQLLFKVNSKFWSVVQTNERGLSIV